MKKTFALFILFFILTAGLKAQEPEHLKFKGIPINGSLKIFGEKMQQKGFELLGTQDGMAVFSGEFAGSKGCTIAASCFENQKVSIVAVVFPARDNWKSTWEEYNSLKDLLSEKYGEPDCLEELNDYPLRNGTDYFWDVIHNRCTILSEFETPQGKIQLTIGKNDAIKISVVLKYLDSINLSEMKDRILEDL